MLRSFRWRIALPYTFLVLILMAGLGIYLTTWVRQNYLQALTDQLLSQARLLAGQLPDIFQDLNPTGSFNNRFDPVIRWAEQEGIRITLIALDGTVLWDSQDNPAEMDNHLSRPEIAQALLLGSGMSARFSQTIQIPLIYTAVKVMDGGQVIGFVRLAVPQTQVQARVVSLQTTLLGASLLVMLAAVILAVWIANSTTRPLKNLTEAVDRFASGGLNIRLVPETADEVGRLTQAFNLMAVQLNSQIQDLEAERSKLAAVLREMSDGVLIVNDQGQIQLINPTAEKLFDVPENTANGRSLAEGLRNHQIFELWQECRKSGLPQSISMETGIRRLSLQGYAIPFGDALSGSTLLLVQNLTRIRQLETVRRDFMSNISHELRTPLATLKALTESLQEGALDDPSIARRFLEKIEAEVDALSHIVSELLELARIELGRVPLHLLPANVQDIINSGVERLQHQAERAGLSLTTTFEDNLPPVLADPIRLEQVVVNLLHNAIKFTEFGGSVRVTSTRSGDQVIVSVLDTGAGIPAKDLPRIFERFFKADRARSSHGTGLGLAISKHLVEAHGGEIWAESQEGMGSSFHFSIPIA